MATEPMPLRDALTGVVRSLRGPESARAGAFFTGTDVVGDEQKHGGGLSRIEAAESARDFRREVEVEVGGSAPASRRAPGLLGSRSRIAGGTAESKRASRRAPGLLGSRVEDENENENDYENEND